MPKRTKKPSKDKSGKKRVNPLRKIVATLLLALSIVSSLLLVTAAYVEHLSPEVHSLPALLGLAFPLFVLSTLFFFLVLLLIYPRYTLVSLVAILSGYATIFPHQPRQ